MNYFEIYMNKRRKKKKKKRNKKLKRAVTINSKGGALKETNPVDSKPEVHVGEAGKSSKRGGASKKAVNVSSGVGR